MKSKDIFHLAIRLLGLVFLYHTLSALPAAALMFTHAALPYGFFYGMERYVKYGEVLVALWMVAWPLLVTLWLVRGAPPIMRIAYPDAATRE